MKKVLLFLLCAALFLIAIPAAASEEDPAEIPEDVLEYASHAGWQGMKAFIEEHGQSVLSQEELDSLEIGSAWRLFDLVWPEENWGSTLRSSGIYVEKWMFLAENVGDNGLLFFVHRLEDGMLAYSGPSLSFNLEKALTVLRGLADKEGAVYNPLITDDFGHGFIVAQDFGGVERIITVPTDIYVLDYSYSQATKSSELPTFEEYKAEYAKKAAENAKILAESDGQPLGDGGVVLLKAHVPKTGLIIAAAALSAAGAGVIAAVIVHAVKKKRAACAL